jgi:hypothetical protein
MRPVTMGILANESRRMFDARVVMDVLAFDGVIVGYTLDSAGDIVVSITRRKSPCTAT